MSLLSKDSWLLHKSREFWFVYSEAFLACNTVPLVKINMFSIYSQLQTDGLHSRFNIRKLNPWISPMKDCGYGSFRTKWSVHSEGSHSAAATTRLHLNFLTNIMKSSSWPDSNFLLHTPVNSTFQERFAWPWVSAACLDFNITFVLRV